MRQEVRTLEVVNVIADTVERLYEESNAEINRPSAEDKALIITRALLYGIGVDERILSRPKITERRVKIPRCRKHR